MHRINPTLSHATRRHLPTLQAQPAPAGGNGGGEAAGSAPNPAAAATAAPGAGAGAGSGGGRKRTRGEELSPEQLARLEAAFGEEQYPKVPAKQQLAEALGVDVAQVGRGVHLHTSWLQLPAADGKSLHSSCMHLKLRLHGPCTACGVAARQLAQLLLSGIIKGSDKLPCSNSCPFSTLDSWLYSMPLQVTKWFEKRRRKKVRAETGEPAKRGRPRGGAPSGGGSSKAAAAAPAAEAAAPTEAAPAEDGDAAATAARQEQEQQQTPQPVQQTPQQAQPHEDAAPADGTSAMDVDSNENAAGAAAQQADEAMPDAPAAAAHAAPSPAVTPLPAKPAAAAAAGGASGSDGLAAAEQPSTSAAAAAAAAGGGVQPTPVQAGADATPGAGPSGVNPTPAPQQHVLSAEEKQQLVEQLTAEVGRMMAAGGTCQGLGVEGAGRWCLAWHAVPAWAMPVAAQLLLGAQAKQHKALFGCRRAFHLNATCARPMLCHAALRPAGCAPAAGGAGRTAASPSY